MEIQKKTVIELDTISITEYKLINSFGSYVSILDFGGIITNLCVPDKNGNISNVVLSYENYLDYIENPCYLGCMLGRNAGRISNGRFFLNQKQYNLNQNNGPSNLHGGNSGFNKKIMLAKDYILDEELVLELSFTSPDGEEGYPGDLNVHCTYTFNNKNELKISYSAESDEDTIVNLSNHTYFNLSGNHAYNITDHKLKIPSNRYISVDADTVPNNIRSVTNSPFDLNEGPRLDSILSCNHEQLEKANGIDHPFILNKNSSICLSHEKSGRILEIETDQPCCVIYTGNYLDSNLNLKENIKGHKHCGIAIETHWFPDFINRSDVPHLITSKSLPYNAYTIYKFKTK